MTSGIYRLDFSDGTYYIGKSVDIAKRWDQHHKGMTAGTHAKSVQAAYNRCGIPTYTVIYECHPDHIDILEDWCISKYWSNSILNTTRPKLLDPKDYLYVGKIDGTYWDRSTVQHIKEIQALQLELEGALEQVADLETGAEYRNMKYVLEEAIDLKHKAQEELKRYKNRGFFARLFNLGV